jgi:hypothetical protein
MSKVVVGSLLLSALVQLSSAVVEAAESCADKRLTPRVLTPVETRIEVFRGCVETYLFSRDFSGIFILDRNEKGGYDVQLLPRQDVRKRPTARPARQPRPIRMALIAGSFPYKQQVEEFRKKLGLPSAEAVLKEAITKGDKTEPTFRFLGVNLQRRTLNDRGEPATPFQSVDPTMYKAWVVHCAERFEPDKPELSKSIVPGLAMSRPILFHEGIGTSSYPEPERRLTKLQQAIKATKGKSADLSEHCLLRVLDVTVEPDRVYQYRLQVRMANPNYGREDVDKLTAWNKELVSDWFEVPGNVVLPSDQVYYVVDEKRLNKKDKPSKDDPRWEMWD